MFFGRKLTLTEQRYSTTEREMLAIVYGYHACYHLVYGRKIVFGTDHKPLVTLCKLKRPFDRLGRLLNHLMGVDYTLEFIPGHLNFLADFMSRAVIQDPLVSPASDISANFTSLVSEINWVQEQSKDQDIANVIRCLLGGLNDSEWLKGKNGSKWLRDKRHLYVSEGVLCYGSNQKVVPSHMSLEILKLFHDSSFAGHRAFGSTLYAISCRYFWPRMFSQVKEYCQSCEKCQAFNYSNMSGKAPLRSIQTSRPGQFIQLDYMGPFSVSKAGNRYICLAVDAHIKFLWYAATVSCDEISTALFLFNEIICKVGPVENIMSDQGACFESNVFKHLCKLIGSNKLRSSAFHPSGNGGIEIVNKVIKPNLAKYVSHSFDDWDVCLGMAVNAYNNSIQSSIGMSPAEALFNRPPVLIADVICGNRLDKGTSIDNISDYTLKLWENAHRIRNELSFNKELAQNKQKAMYDRSLQDNRVYKIGDSVKIKNFKRTPGLCAAFERKFQGPFVIVEIVGDLNYRIKSESGTFQVVHYNRMLPFHLREADLNIDVAEELVKSQSPLVVDERPFQRNLDNLTSIVVCYKAKLRRRQARELLAEMNNTVPVVNMVQSFGSLDIVNSSSDNSEVFDDVNNELNISLNEDGGLNRPFVPPVAEISAAVGFQEIGNTRGVGLAEWERIGALAQEVRVNEKNKKLGLCWQCQGWYEAKQGMIVHKRSCTMPMPILIVLAENGDGGQRTTILDSLEVSRASELYFYKSVPIYSDVSDYSDTDPSLLDQGRSFVTGLNGSTRELSDSDSENIKVLPQRSQTSTPG